MGSQTLACLIRLTLHFIAARLPDPPLSTPKSDQARGEHIKRKRSAVIPSHTQPTHMPTDRNL